MDEINELLKHGKIQVAIEQLQSMPLPESKKEELIAIEFQYNQAQRDERMGTLSVEQFNSRQSQIIVRIIEMIKAPDDTVFPKDFSNAKEATPKAVIWKSIVALGVIVGIVAGGIAIAQAFGPEPPPLPAKLLTIFVTDEQGNATLAHTGRINTSIGHRSFNEIIGDNGRTNFAEITNTDIGDTITIGLLAPGWEIIDRKNRFVFTGEPIQLKVRKDDSLRRITGSVKTRDGQSGIDHAKVEINADTAIYTTTDGLFNIVLPPSMGIVSESERYLLTVSKSGYQTVSEYYSPGSTDSQIRLERN